MAAILVGSAVAGRGGAVADLDVTGFDPNVAFGEDRSIEFTWNGWPVHVVCYHPMHFEAVARRSQLVFVFTREIRKLREGVILFDEGGALEETRGRLASVAFPYHLLDPLVHVVARLKVAEARTAPARLGLYHAVESLAYAWMHLDMRYRYTKPKWLLDDARLVDSRGLVPLLREISLELVGTHRLDRLAAGLRRYLAEGSDAREATLARSNLGDAETLLRDGREVEAVWPLRMSVYMLARWWAGWLDVRYDDLRCIEAVANRLRELGNPLGDAIRDALLLDAPVNAKILRHWASARGEFLSAWRTVRTESASAG